MSQNSENDNQELNNFMDNYEKQKYHFQESQNTEKSDSNYSEETITSAQYSYQLPTFSSYQLDIRDSSSLHLLTQGQYFYSQPNTSNFFNQTDAWSNTQPDQTVWNCRSQTESENSSQEN